MAPEQAFAEPLDRRADVFAMGIVAWEALTGRRLFENRTIQQVARGVALGEIPAPSQMGAGTPQELDRIILRALAPWRQDRYPTAAAFADAIYEFTETEGGLAPSSAVAEVLELVCGDVIRERRDRVRAACRERSPEADVEPESVQKPTSADVARREDALTVRATSPRSGETIESVGQATPARIATPATVSVDLDERDGRASTRSSIWAPIAGGAMFLAGIALGHARGAESTPVEPRQFSALVSARAAASVARLAARIPCPCGASGVRPRGPR
jgi:hypothetical protein